MDVMNSTSMTETYANPRAKVVAEREHAKMLNFSPTESLYDDSMVVHVSIRAEATEYGAYTLETIFSPRLSAKLPAIKSERSVIRRGDFSLHNNKKRSASLIDEAPSPQRLFGFCSNSVMTGSYFHPPSITRRNARVGRFTPAPKEEVREDAPIDAVMASTGDFALPDPALPLPQPAMTALPQYEAAVVRSSQQHPIVVNDSQEEQPNKKIRLAVPSFLGHFCKGFPHCV
jgi:hypothetical protein